MAYLVSCSTLIQTAVLLLQVYKGGAVILPKFLRPRRYLLTIFFVLLVMLVSYSAQNVECSLVAALHHVSRHRYNYMRLSVDGDVAVEMLERAQDCVICMQPFDVGGSDATAITPCDHVR